MLYTFSKPEILIWKIEIIQAEKQFLFLIQKLNSEHKKFLVI